MAQLTTMDTFISALELADAIRTKKISPTEAAQFYLDRIDKINPQLNAVVWRRDTEFLKEAEAATDAVMRGDDLAPFHGVPIPIKDLTCVTGWPTTFGCKGAKDYVADHSDAVVDNFKKGGFLFMCRTNTPEFGTLSVTENELYGATRNPWDTSRTPGGSSGGAASMCASGLTPVAHANDGGGSIRIPASCCGLVGLKPSRGRVPSGPPGISDVMHGGCVEGVVTHTVADTAAILDLLAVQDPLAWYNAPAPVRPFALEAGEKVAKLRVACMTQSPNGSPVADQCVKAVRHTAALLADLGHEIVEEEFSFGELIAEVYPSFMTVWNTGSVYWPIQDWSKIEPCNAAMREISSQVDSLTYLQALQKLQTISRAIVSHWMSDFDVLVTPTVAYEPPKIGALFEGADNDPMMPLMNAAGMAPFTPMFNATGQPAISLPLAWSEAGLPIGVHFVGAPWAEDVLIRLAAQLEEAAPWVDKHPSIG